MWMTTRHCPTLSAFLFFSLLWLFPVFRWYFMMSINQVLVGLRNIEWGEVEGKTPPATFAWWTPHREGKCIFADFSAPTTQRLSFFLLFLCVTSFFGVGKKKVLHTFTVSFSYLSQSGFLLHFKAFQWKKQLTKQWQKGISYFNGHSFSIFFWR